MGQDEGKAGNATSGSQEKRKTKKSNVRENHEMNTFLHAANQERPMKEQRLIEKARAARKVAIIGPKGKTSLQKEAGVLSMAGKGLLKVSPKARRLAATARKAYKSMPKGVQSRISGALKSVDDKATNKLVELVRGRNAERAA